MRSHILYLSISPILLLACNTTDVLSPTFKCASHSNYSLEVKDATKHMVVCANKNAENELLTEIAVVNKFNDSVIFESTGDAITKYSVANTDSGLAIVDYRFMPVGDKFEEMMVIPSNILLMSASTPQDIKSKYYSVFSYPPLTPTQIDTINKVCVVIADKINPQAKSQYPLPYETMYLLYLGAYHKMDNAFEIWTHLADYFEFDGAVSETYSELGAGDM